jgi:hypothetical protein
VSTANSYYLTPENTSQTLGIGGDPAVFGGGGFLVNVYANLLNAVGAAVMSSTLTVLGNIIVNTLVGTYGNTISYDGSNQLFIGVPGTTSAKKLTVIDSAGTGLAYINGVGDFANIGTITERGRGVPIGDWISPSFNAGDYTGRASMTWTVASGDVMTFAYTMRGKTMTVSLVLLTTTVGGTPSTSLQVAIPGGFTAAKAMQSVCEVLDNGARTTGRINVAASGTLIAIQRTDLANWAASTDNTAVRGQLEFEVQ